MWFTICVSHTKTLSHNCFKTSLKCSLPLSHVCFESNNKKEKNKKRSPRLIKRYDGPNLNPFMSVLVLTTRVISSVRSTFCGSWKQGILKLNLKKYLIGKKFGIDSKHSLSYRCQSHNLHTSLALLVIPFFFPIVFFNFQIIFLNKFSINENIHKITSG